MASLIGEINQKGWSITINLGPVDKVEIKKSYDFKLIGSWQFYRMIIPLANLNFSNDNHSLLDKYYLI